MILAKSKSKELFLQKNKRTNHYLITYPMNIYFKFVFLCLFLILFTGGTFFYFVNIEAQKVLKAQILDEISQQSVNSMNNIERFIYERISDISSLSNSVILKNKQSKALEIANYLQKLHQLNEIYYSFSYFDANRIRIADSKNLEINKKHALKNYWIDIERGKEVVVDISTSSSAKNNVLHFAAIIKDEKNQKQGVIVSRVLIEKLYEVFEEVPYNKHIKDNLMIDLIDKNGTLLYSNYQPEKILKEKYENLQPLKDTNNSFVFIETQKKLSFFVREQGYLSYKGNQWTLIISVPTEKAFTPLIKIRNRILFLFVPIILIGILVSLYLARRFSRPIIRLAKAAQALGNEDWSADTHVDSHDELRILGKELHKMGTKIKNKIEEQSILNEDLSQKYKKIQEQNEELETQKNFIENQNKLIQDKNDRITASINYAQRIQSAMLPENDDLDQNFEEHFIYYAPKDIVSGDFYWFDVIDIREKKYFVLAVADCTGHGVPGAILSMLGNNLLSNFVSYQKITNTQKILYLLDKYIKEELNQQNNQTGISQDGMEIGICTIDLDTLKMQFSGGGRPMYIFRDNALIELKADKITIGGVGYTNKKNVEDQYFEITAQYYNLQKDDIFYLFSDGYKDQFGGEENRKVGTKDFKKLLLTIQNKPLYLQKTLIENHFNAWKGNYEQIDDVLVMGVKI
ncbi:MAG: HAMP domain-containing protein [Cytophagales bacterium]|nr:MAG: HAMP domain-containing protein [Cytophagales bacterium]